jgi:DNA-binding NtrC family response regulator
LSFESFLGVYLERNRGEIWLNGLPTLEELKKEYICYLLDMTRENVEEVAQILHLPKDILLRELARYHISV